MGEARHEVVRDASKSKRMPRDKGKLAAKISLVRGPQKSEGPGLAHRLTVASPAMTGPSASSKLYDDRRYILVVAAQLVQLDRRAATRHDHSPPWRQVFFCRSMCASSVSKSTVFQQHPSERSC
jgi:hypothetical protein